MLQGSNKFSTVLSKTDARLGQGWSLEIFRGKTVNLIFKIFRYSYPILRHYLSYIFNTVPYFTRTFLLVLLWIMLWVPLNARLCAAHQPGASQVTVIMTMTCLWYHLVLPNLCVQVLSTDTQCAEYGTHRMQHPCWSYTRAARIWHPKVKCNRQLLSTLDSEVCLRLGVCTTFREILKDFFFKELVRDLPLPFLLIW